MSYTLSPLSPFVPKRFGPYTLLRPVGQGGMAEVFLAQAVGVEGFERLLCVKRVLDEHSNDTELIDHLVDEAKIVSRISHANVAQVFDLGRVGEQFYIAMEWIDGVDALKLLEACEQREIHVPTAAAAYIVHEIARGLQAAHTTTDEDGRPLGIVHRDVTPTNVLLSLEGQVKLIDFGVAKNILRSRQTAVGVVKGKYNYLAPEQARGEKVDARADVFGAGILLYELLAGEPLYPGTKAADVLAKARAGKIPSLRKLRADVPPELEAIVMRALEKDRERRTPSAAALADELEGFLTRTSPDFGGPQLASLVAYLFPERVAAAIDGDPMVVSDFVAHGPSSLVTAPGVQVRGDDDFDASPTRVASVEEIASRRAARASGVPLAPVPPLPPRAHRRPPGLKRGIAMGVAGALLVALVAWGLTRWAHQPVLRIESTPSGAFVALDGLGTGRATPAEIELPAGMHQLGLSLDGYEDHAAPVQLSGDLTISVSLRASRASLEIVSEPPGAMVLRDGALLGSTPFVLRDLGVGDDVTLEVHAAGFVPLRYVHHVSDGSAARTVLHLDPSP
jgi:serine/threonine-protein kinase